MKWRHGSWIAAILLLSACEFTEFEIDMEVDGDELVRRLVTRRVEEERGERRIGDYPVEVLRGIAAAYGADIPDPIPESPSFSGRFRGRTPSDVGGAGHLAVYQAPMGRLVAYSEQFRGEADPGVVIERAFTAADRWIDLIIGWLQGEIGELAGWDELRDLLDQGLRKDLKNLVAIFFQTAGSDTRLTHRDGGGPDGEDEFMIRALHLMVINGYVTDEDVPRLFRALNRSGAQAVDAGLPILRRAIVRAAGLDEDEAAVDRLIALLGSDDVDASLARHVETTDHWKERLAAWEEAHRDDPGSVRPEPSSLLDDLLTDMIGSGPLSGTDDHLTVRLRCTTPPHRTNGLWSAESRVLEWKGVPAHKGQLPSHIYAFWAEPASVFQEERFGRVVLRGEALESYVLWYHGLTPGERRQWDRLMSGLRSGADVQAQIRSFVFQGPDGKPVKDRPADEALPKERGRDLLLEALEAPQ